MHGNRPGRGDLLGAVLASAMLASTVGWGCGADTVAASPSALSLPTRVTYAGVVFHAPLNWRIGPLGASAVGPPGTKADCYPDVLRSPAAASPNIAVSSTADSIEFFLLSSATRTCFDRRVFYKGTWRSTQSDNGVDMKVRTVIYWYTISGEPGKYVTEYWEIPSHSVARQRHGAPSDVVPPAT